MMRLPALVAGLAAVLFALMFAWGTWSVVSLLALFTRETGSGGIGAVSSGVVEYLLPFVSAAIANRVIARWARQSGALVRGLHVTHSVMLLTVPVLIFAWILGLLGGAFTQGGSLVPFMMATIAALFIGQIGLMSILLALFALERRRPVLRTL